MSSRNEADCETYSALESLATKAANNDALNRDDSDIFVVDREEFSKTAVGKSLKSMRGRNGAHSLCY